MNEIHPEPTIREILFSIHEHVEELQICDLALSGIVIPNFEIMDVKGNKYYISMDAKERKRFFGPRLKDVKDKLLVDLIPALKKKIQDVK